MSTFFSPFLSWSNRVLADQQEMGVTATNPPREGLRLPATEEQEKEGALESQRVRAKGEVKGDLINPPLRG